MQYIKMPIAEVPIVREKQVIVAGGGPAGIAAAIAAARNGASTILLERYGYLGGMATTGLPFLTFHDKKGSQVINGIAGEMIDRLLDKGAALGHLPAKVVEHRLPSTITPIDPEEFKDLSMEMAIEAGVELRLHSWAFEVFKQGKNVKGLIALSKSGLEAIKGDIVIDCTGDGDLAVRAGADYEQGRLEDGKSQPPSLVFTMANVNIQEMSKVSSEKLLEMGKKANKEGKLPESINRVWTIKLPMAGCVGVNGSRELDVDGTKVEDLTRAEINLRKQNKMVIKWLKEEVPGFQNSILIETSCQMGIRETRRIMGEYKLTAEDVLDGREFDDAICRGSYSLDIHNPEGVDVTLIAVKSGGSYTIPYRTLIPQNIENLLVGGRCISTTSEALGSTRVMAPCMAIGEGAGTAAAIAVKDHVSLRDLDIVKLRKTLIDQGVIL